MNLIHRLGSLIFLGLGMMLPNVHAGTFHGVNPVTTAFCFDFTDVIATEDTGNRRLGYAGLLVKHPLLTTLLFKPEFWEDVAYARKNMLVDGAKPLYGMFAKLDYLQKKYWVFSEDVKRDVLKIRARFILNEDIIYVLKQLKQRGFELYILTNIDHKFLKEYIKPYIEAEYQVNLDELFDNYFSPEDGEDKLSTDFYKRVARYINPSGKKQLMLIDAETRYLNTAYQTQEGYIAHLYTTVERLVEDEIVQQALSRRKLQS